MCKWRQGHSHFCTCPVLNVGKSLWVFPKGCVSCVLGFTKQKDWCMCLRDRQWRVHCTPGESIKSYWSHANSLRFCLDWSTAHQEPDKPEVTVCTPAPDVVVVFGVCRWASVGEEVVACSKGTWNAWTALAAGHLDAGVWAHSCWDFGWEEEKIRSWKLWEIWSLASE